MTRAKLANGAVNSQKITTGGVKAGDLANAAVTNSKLQTGAVSSAKLGVGAVTTEKLGNGAVTKEKLANGAVATQFVTKLSGDKPLAPAEAEILAIDLAGFGAGYTWGISVGVDALGTAECRIVDQDTRLLGAGIHDLSGGAISLSAAKLASNGVATKARLLCSATGGATMQEAHMTVAVAPA